MVALGVLALVLALIPVMAAIPNLLIYRTPAPATGSPTAPGRTSLWCPGASAPGPCSRTLS